MLDKKDLAAVDQEGNQIAITKETVKKHLCPKATDNEIFMFLNIARAYELNPFKREIHLVKYGEEKANIIVGYESYLKRAERSGKLDGWKCWIEKTETGEKAVIEIKRKDFSEPIRWEVDRSEFDRGKATWKTMPNFMLKKVAIAQGFRLAFPEDLGGMPYIAEEVSDRDSNELPGEELPPNELGGGHIEKIKPDGKSTVPTQETIDAMVEIVGNAYVSEFEKFILNNLMAKKITDTYLKNKIVFWTKEIAKRKALDEEKPNDCIKYLNDYEAKLREKYPKLYEEFMQK